MKKPVALGFSYTFDRLDARGWISKISEAERLTRAKGRRSSNEEKTGGGRGPYLDYENSVKGASVGMLICTYSLNQLAGQFVSQLSVSVVNHAWETCVVGLLSETKV